MSKVIDNWMERHQDKTSFVLHMIGIPLTILAIPAVIVGGVHDLKWLYWLAGGLFVFGYALQFVGHAIEGNDAGETILVKKIMGKPYIAIVDKNKTDQKDEA